METFQAYLSHPAVAWFGAAITGGAIGAYVNGLVERRMKRIGKVRFLQTQIVAANPRDDDNLFRNRYSLELRMHNTSDEPKVIESPVMTFNTKDGMNIPFLLNHADGQPLDYLVVSPGEMKIVPVEIETQEFNFHGIREPRPAANRCLQDALTGSHVQIHFRYASEKRLQSQAIFNPTEMPEWANRPIIHFPN